MIVDEQIKTIFLHNPKSGGTFFRKVYTDAHHTDQAYRYLRLYDERVNTDLGHISLGNLPRFVPDCDEYRILSFVRNPYNRFVSALETTYLHNTLIRQLGEDCRGDVKQICRCLLSLSAYRQDMMLRNRRIPWLNPQSNYADHRTIVLRYESLADWRFLFHVFSVGEPEVRIKADYILDDETKSLIRKLYFDDVNIFRLYGSDEY